MESTAASLCCFSAWQSVKARRVSVFKAAGSWSTQTGAIKAKLDRLEQLSGDVHLPGSVFLSRELCRQRALLLACGRWRHTAGRLFLVAVRLAMRPFAVRTRAFTAVTCQWGQDEICNNKMCTSKCIQQYITKPRNKQLCGDTSREKAKLRLVTRKRSVIYDGPVTLPTLKRSRNFQRTRF